MEDVYTVADAEGNLFQLQASSLGLTAGVYVLEFVAVVPGVQLTIPNTIRVPVTIVLGVTSVNNPTAASAVGVAYEADAKVKVRRQRSVAQASQGYLPALEAALENIPGITSAYVYENDSSVTDADGVPSHTIWVIVAGSASAALIANAIYKKRNAGCGMYGSESYVISRENTLPLIILWDYTDSQYLFIKFTVGAIDSSLGTPDISAIKAGILAGFTPGVFATVNINALATLVQEVDSNTLVTSAGFSNAILQTLQLGAVQASGSFKIRYGGVDSALINWNDSTPTVQTKVRAVTGLATVVVTGDLGAQTLSFDLSSLGDVVGLLTVNTNTLMTSGPVAVTVSWSQSYANTLTPRRRNNQFVISADNIIILPIALTPLTSTVATAGVITFLAYGGYGSFTYSILVNNSGGSINASTGVYTAGAVSGVQDTIKAVDLFGNIATAGVSVT